MLRMAHRICEPASSLIMSSTIAPGSEFETRESIMRLIEHSGQAIDRVRKSTVIVADNVAAMFDDKYHVGDDLPIEDFPNCVPCESSLFIEWSTADSSGLDRQYGVQIATVDMSDPDAISSLSTHARVFAKVAAQTSSNLIRWICDADVFLFVSGTLVWIDGHAVWAADETGELSGHYIFVNNKKHDESRASSLKREIGNAMSHAWMTCSFMNCKNVKKNDATEELGPSAKWIRRQKAPTIRYHVLDINPMKEVLRSEGGIETNGLKKALHICRGHFAHYANGLFGRGEACTIWKPAHVRGQAEQGIVLKDYRVKTGN